jgi:hypothetical protein
MEAASGPQQQKKLKVAIAGGGLVSFYISLICNYYFYRFVVLFI